MSLNDTLADEASPPDPTAPALKPLVALDRRARAQLMRGMASLLPRAQELMTAPVADLPDMPARNAGKKVWADFARRHDVQVPANATRAQIQQAVDDTLASPAEMSSADLFRYQADVLDLAADVEDLVVVLAVDPDATKKWAATVDSMELVRVFFAWSRGAQPGEAKRSSS